MANLFFNLPIPAGDGAGAAVNVATLGALKTFVVGNTPGPSGEAMRCTLNIEMSNEAAAPAVDNEWAPVWTFQDIGDIVIPIACKWLRIRRSDSKSPSGTPSCDVGSDDSGAILASLTATAGNGSGASVNTSALPVYKTVQVGGAFRGNVNIEISNDNVHFSPEFSFTGNGGQQSASFTADFMRVSRDGVPVIDPGLPIVNIAASVSPGTTGGGSGSLQEAQAFQYVATGAEGSDFFVPFAPLPARSNDLYQLQCTQADVTFILGYQFPNTAAGDRTTTQFRMVTTAPVTAGDTFMFIVYDPT